MKILVGYDGSDAAKRALRLAREHAKVFGAEIIHVLHAKVTDLPREQHELQKEEIERVTKEVEKEGCRCKGHLVISNLGPGPYLVEFARQEAVDEIFIGVRMKSRIGKLLIGSTARYVILEAPCPVVTVK